MYQQLIHDSLEQFGKMAFICGPRQVGKTTLAKTFFKGRDGYLYLNWDNLDDRKKILEGPAAIVKGLSLERVFRVKPLLVLDEIHKYNEWKSLVKGLYDTYGDELQIIVTGSARLNVYSREGDSMMGRYFQYRIHPLSVGELLSSELDSALLKGPRELDDDKIDQLLKLGGYPEPFLHNDSAFSHQWHSLRHQQMMNQDLRDISEVRMISRIEVLSEFIKEQAGQLFNFSNTARKLRVSDASIRHWIDVLEELYYCFRIQPWSKNVERSLMKNPKFYLWDWSRIKDSGARLENLVASHLLKACHFWTDRGLGVFKLHFVRDKDKHEVDFLLSKDQEPWILVEVKRSQKKPLSRSLLRFKEQLNPKYAFQVAYDMPYVDVDFRDLKKPKIIPVSTFLSQLP